MARGTTLPPPTTEVTSLSPGRPVRAVGHGNERPGNRQPARCRPRHGHGYRRTPAGFFNGVIDEARVWNLAQRPRRSPRACRTRLSGSGLIARSGLNEGSGATVANSVSGGPAGTADGGPAGGGSDSRLHQLPNEPPAAPTLDRAGGRLDRHPASGPTLSVRVSDPEGNASTRLSTAVSMLRRPRRLHHRRAA